MWLRPFYITCTLSLHFSAATLDGIFNIFSVYLVIVSIFPFLFQNGLVTSSPEMFKLKSCIRRKTDSIDKRFCFDIEVVERFDLFFLLYILLLLCLDINMNSIQRLVFQSLFENSIHVYFILSHINSTNIYYMMFSKN